MKNSAAMPLQISLCLIIAITAGCSGIAAQKRDALSSAEVSMLGTAETSTNPEVETTIDSSPPTTVPDPFDSLDDYAASRAASIASAVVNHECGPVSVVETPTGPQFAKFDGTEWSEVRSVQEWLSQFSNTVERIEFDDITFDGVDEIVVLLSPGDYMRSFGGVLHTTTPECQWKWLPLVDSCGNQTFYDGVYLSEGILHGNGFSGECSLRENVYFEWLPTVNMMGARPIAPTKMCPDFVTDDLNLPVITCERGWVVNIMQDRLDRLGYNLDVDGYFGPGTQLALLEFQLDYRLEPSGVADLETWGALFEVDWDAGFADYDGDGIPSPIEIAHWSGADLLD